MSPDVPPPVSLDDLVMDKRHYPSSGIDVAAEVTTLTLTAPSLSDILGHAPSTTPPPETIDWSRLDDDARETLGHARAANTLKAYSEDWKQFVGWAQQTGRVSLPADAHDVARFLAHLGAVPRSVSKIQRAAAAIAYAHRIAGAIYNARHPVLLEMIAALRRKLGTAPTNQKKPLVQELLMKCAPCGTRLIDVRDRAILSLEFLSGARGCNVVALNVNDVTFTENGLDIILRKSKTDQTGKGFPVSIPVLPGSPLCATRTVRSWMTAASITDGALFRSVDRYGHVGDRLGVQELRRIVRRHAERAGLTLPDSKEFGAHSLRAGFCTTAAEEGCTLEQIIRQTGQSPATAMRYIRHANRFKDNAAEGLLGATSSTLGGRTPAGRCR